MYGARPMSRMVRKQVYIEPEQEALLKRRARELHVTEAELIRRGIDQVAIGSLRPVPSLDQQAWAEAKAFAKRRRRPIVPQTGRKWTREELYDERLDRLSR